MKNYVVAWTHPKVQQQGGTAPNYYPQESQILKFRTHDHNLF